MPSDWSPAEKKIARRVFDAALQHELAEVMQKFKSMAAKVAERFGISKDKMQSILHISTL